MRLSGIPTRQAHGCKIEYPKWVCAASWVRKTLTQCSYSKRVASSAVRWLRCCCSSVYRSNKATKGYSPSSRRHVPWRLRQALAKGRASGDACVNATLRVYVDHAAIVGIGRDDSRQAPRVWSVERRYASEWTRAERQLSVVASLSRVDLNSLRLSPLAQGKLTLIYLYLL